MKLAIKNAIDELSKLPVDKLREERYEKFRKMGRFIEGENYFKKRLDCFVTVVPRNDGTLVVTRPVIASVFCFTFMLVGQPTN